MAIAPSYLVTPTGELRTAAIVELMPERLWGVASPFRAGNDPKAAGQLVTVLGTLNPDWWTDPDVTTYMRWIHDGHGRARHRRYSWRRTWR